MEIERKYLVKPTNLFGILKNVKIFYIDKIEQGYFDIKEAVSIRIRKQRRLWPSKIQTEYSITLKEQVGGLARQECNGYLEQEAKYFFDSFCKRKISKLRYTVLIDHADKYFWEIDVFDYPDINLIIAEKELPDKRYKFDKPEWLGVEVTDNQYFYNERLHTGRYRAFLDKFLQK